MSLIRFCSALALGASPVAAQQTSAGKIADFANGEVGQRQTRGQESHSEPLARIDTRIQNRVQSRIRNRIDRYYDPQANAVAPFVAAGEQSRMPSRSSNR